MTSDIRIYVACLAAYNGGRLHGVWIDANGYQVVKGNSLKKHKVSLCQRHTCRRHH